MKAFKFYRRYWAAIGGGLFVALAFFIGLWGQNLPDLRRFMVLMFMALLFHQFEEYIFPAAANIGRELHLPVLLLVGSHLRIPGRSLIEHSPAYSEFPQARHALWLCQPSGR